MHVNADTQKRNLRLPKDSRVLMGCHVPFNIVLRGFSFSNYENIVEKVGKNILLGLDLYVYFKYVYI